jgi:hypothetical protein
MFHTTTARSSAAEGMRAYGLSGIELGHHTRQRETGAARDLQLQELQVRGSVGNLRQRLGDALVRLGAGVAGEGARPAPRAAIRPKATMP